MTVGIASESFYVIKVIETAGVARDDGIEALTEIELLQTI